MPDTPHEMGEFEVKQPDIEAKLYAIGRALKEDMPEGWGFTLLLFDYTTDPGGSLFYLSSAERKDVIETMKEFLRKQGETSL